MMKPILTRHSTWALSLMLALGTACSDEDLNYDWADGGAHRDGGPNPSTEREKVKADMEAILNSEASGELANRPSLTELVVTATRADAFFVQFAKDGPALKIDYKVLEDSKLKPGVEVSFVAESVKVKGDHGNSDILTVINDLHVSDKTVNIDDWAQPISSITADNFKAMRYELVSDEGHVPNQVFKATEETQGLFFLVDGKRAPLTIYASNHTVKSQSIQQFSQIKVVAPLESDHGAMQLNPRAKKELVNLKKDAFALVDAQSGLSPDETQTIITVLLNQDLDRSSMGGAKDWTVTSTDAKSFAIDTVYGHTSKSDVVVVVLEKNLKDDHKPARILIVKAPSTLKAKSETLVTPGLDSARFGVIDSYANFDPRYEGEAVLTELVRNTQPNQSWVEIYQRVDTPPRDLQNCIFTDDSNQSVRVIPSISISQITYYAFGFVEHGGTWEGPKDVTPIELGPYESWSLDATDQIELRCPDKDGKYHRVFKLSYTPEFPGSEPGEAAGLKHNAPDGGHDFYPLDYMSDEKNWCVETEATPGGPTLRCAK